MVSGTLQCLSPSSQTHCCSRCKLLLSLCVLWPRKKNHHFHKVITDVAITSLHDICEVKNVQPSAFRVSLFISLSLLSFTHGLPDNSWVRPLEACCIHPWWLSPFLHQKLRWGYHLCPTCLSVPLRLWESMWQQQGWWDTLQHFPTCRSLCLSWTMLVLLKITCDENIMWPIVSEEFSKGLAWTFLDICIRPSCPLIIDWEQCLSALNSSDRWYI